MRSLFLILAALVAVPAFAAPPPIRVPDVVEPAAPVTPPEPPKPVAVPLLTADTLYVVDSDVDCIVTASPPGIVSITAEAGPVKIRGKFIDGSRKTETRTFKGKSVFTVEPLASGRVEILIIPVGAKTESEIIRRAIDSNTGPQPPPTPGPGPTPGPSTAPIAGDGFKMLLVFEKQDATKYPAAQWNAIYGADVRAYLNSRCAVGPDGKTKEWRIYDKDTPMAGESSVWIDAMKRPRQSLPWIILSDGKSGFEGPLPATAGEIDALLKKWGK